MGISRHLIYFVVMLAPTALVAQSMQQPGTATVVVTRPAPVQVDLSIASVEWLPPQPLRDESQFLNATTSLATAPARLLLLGPKLFVNAVTETVGPRQGSSVAASVVVSPIIRVKVRNAGKERWASTGNVSVVVFQGRPEDVSKSSDFAKLINESKTLVPVGRGVWANGATYFVSRGDISGSVGPNGQEAEVQIAFLNGLAHPQDRLARFRYRMLVDKYYTARVELMTQGDDTRRNNAADFVFRLGANGMMVEGSMVQRETGPMGATTGAPRVTVEGGGGVTVKPKP